MTTAPVLQRDTLDKVAARIRSHVVDMCAGPEGGHLGGAFSCADVLAALYFSVLNVNPLRPDDPDRDRFLLSKGHAAVGLYATLSYTVSLHTHEIGVRMALGASASRVRNLVIRQGLALAGTGLFTGILAALALTRLLKAQLYGISPMDPVSYFAVPVVLMLVALLAASEPTRRATRVDPIVALRHE